jgi:hypothetical protein
MNKLPNTIYIISGIDGAGTRWYWMKHSGRYSEPHWTKNLSHRIAYCNLKVTWRSLENYATNDAGWESGAHWEWGYATHLREITVLKAKPPVKGKLWKNILLRDFTNHKTK